MKTIKCRVCNITKPIACYRKSSNNKTYNHICKECQRERMKRAETSEPELENRKNIITLIKMIETMTEGNTDEFSMNVIELCKKINKHMEK